ncbi:hypothetical protein D3C76_1220830 [compost metagenome]
MQQHFSATAQGADKGLNRGQMIRIGRIHDRVCSTRLFAENERVIQGAEYRGDAQRQQRTALFRITQQATDFMTRIYQVFGNRAADVTGHTGNENFQCSVSFAS